jgi:hypothetical protein
MFKCLAISAVVSASAINSAAAESVSYCPDLKQVIVLATSKDRFRSITGSPKEGSYHETSLALSGWNDCLLYGATTYTCDSRTFETSADAEQGQAEILRDIKDCVGETWAEAKDRSSANYVVLHHAARPVSITLSTDQTGTRKHVVRLTLFVRRN